ncbi:MAG: inositol monophosphatase [Candidatus Dadabacteria bacterium]|nr:MAG: inositol monophosphatase [Candidatus Dadabacteria bacterium]
MEELNFKEELNTALKAAEKAAEVIKSLRDEVLENKGGKRQWYKGGDEIVTTADLKANEIILSTIKEDFPDAVFLSEESEKESNLYSAKLWIVDPIDGTVNYSRGHLNVGISIAYAENGEVKVGVVHCPFLNETYWAVKKAGAFLNGNPLRIKDSIKLENSLIATGFPYKREKRERLVKLAGNVLNQCGDIRRLGAASVDICWIASRRIDGYYETVSAWDIAAALLIAKEAGALVGRYKNTTSLNVPDDLNGENLLVAVPSIFNKLKELLAE